MRLPRGLSFLFVTLCFGSPLRAAPPTVTYLFPAGGQRGTTVEVTAGGTFDKWPVQVWTNDKAVSATAGKEKGKLSIRIAADAVPGVCWVRLHDEQGASNLRPFVVGLLPEVAEKEPNDEVAKPQVVGVPTVVNGRLDKAGDVDVFAVELKKGQTLVASVEANHVLKSPMDGVLQIVSPDGFTLDQNNDWHGLDPQIAFAAPKDGTYLVRLFAFPATPDASIRISGADTYIYRLALSTGGFADFPVPLAVERKPGATVEIRGWNIPADARRLPVPGTGDASTVFSPALANPVRVRLESHSCFDVGKPSGPLTPPFSATGHLAKPDDAGTFPITAKKGHPLVIRVESRALGLAVNPVIRVLDGTGKQLARAEPAQLNQDAELTFSPPADSTFTIEVHDLHAGGGPRHVYLLRVTPPEPGFDLTVAADRFALKPGTSLDIPVTIARKAGFTKEVEVAAEGLPPGVTAAISPPAGKSDPNKVVLRLTAEKPGPGGPFHIVGKSKDLPGVTRTATAAVAELDTTTADLWLAVGGEVPAAPAKKKK